MDYESTATNQLSYGPWFVIWAVLDPDSLLSATYPFFVDALAYPDDHEDHLD